MATWTSRTSSWDSLLVTARAVWSETLGLFVAVGSDGSATDTVQTSPDGITWTGQGDPFTPDVPVSLGGKLALLDSDPLLLAGTNGGIYSSSDGTTWAQVSSPFDTASFSSGFTSVNAFAYSPSLDLWVAGGGSPAPGTASDLKICSSPDGVTWTAETTPWDDQTGGDNQLYDAAWSEDLGLFVMCGVNVSTGKVFLTSPDGTTWTERTSPFDGFASAGMQIVIWSPTLQEFIAGGQVDSSYSGYDGDSWLQSTDGTTWSALTNDPFKQTGSGTKDGIGMGAVDTGTQVLIGGYRYRIFERKSVYSSPDGTTWTDDSCTLLGGRSLAYSPSIPTAVASGGYSTTYRLANTTEPATFLGQIYRRY